MSKLTVCKVCKKEIAKSAKRCPHCGAKLKHPIRNVLLGILGFIIFCSIIGNIDNGENNGDIPGTTPIANEPTSTHDLINKETSTEVETTISYPEVTVSQLHIELNENALAAKNRYSNKYIYLTGYLQTIDADGKYISMSAKENVALLENTVMCYIKNDVTRNRVATLVHHQQITIKCLVTDVDEVWGYKVNIIDIE